jgi:predicted  nucleic acid-binding Zn-ribbon protein
MQAVYEKLQGLQEILSKKIKVETEIREIPRALSTKTELLNRLKKSFIEKNAQYDQIREKMGQFKQKMAEAEEQRVKYEGQMDQIKTQREYEALDKEIREASEKELQFRKDFQKEEKTLEEMKYALEREEQMIKSQESDLNVELEKVHKETEKRKKSLKQLEAEEQEIIPGLDEEMLFKFERIIRSKSGLGIVPLKRGVCTGCHMILPMQFVNQVRTGEGILFCPYCSRILYFEDDGEEAVYQEQAEGLTDLVDFDLDDDSFDDEEASGEESTGDDEEGGSARESFEEEEA